MREDRIAVAGFRVAAPPAWRITYAGPQVHYRAGGFVAAARLMPTVAEAAGATGVEPEVDLRPVGVTVQLRQDPDGTVPAGSTRFAGLVDAAAQDLGLEADPERVQTVSLAIAQHPDVDVRPFWTAALGYEAVGAGAQDPIQRGPYLSFQRLDRRGRGRSHVDVSIGADDLVRRTAAALAAGGRIADDSYAPDWIALASPENHGVDLVTWPDRI